MRSVGLLLTMFSLASLLALTACGGEAAPETAPTTTVGAGPSASGSTEGTSPRVIVAEPTVERRTVVVEAPAPPTPPSVTVTVPSPPSVTITH